MPSCIFLMLLFQPWACTFESGFQVKVVRMLLFFAPCHHLCSYLMTHFNGGPLTGVDLFRDNFFWLFYFPLRSISSLPKLLQNLSPGMAAELSIEVERLLRSIQPVVPKPSWSNIIRWSNIGPSKSFLSSLWNNLASVLQTDGKPFSIFQLV